MASADRFAFILKWAGTSGLVLSLLFAATYALNMASLPVVGAVMHPRVAPPDAPEPVSLRTDWSVFQGAADASPVSRGEGLAERFRFLGSFFVYDEGSAAGDPPEVRAAILQELSSKREFVLQEGTRVDDVLVLSVERDRVRLRDAHEEVVIANAVGGDTADSSDRVRSGASGPRTSVGRGAYDFGQSTNDGKRWVLRREALTAYYKELLDEPDRLVGIFDTMAPVYGDEGKITGYVRKTVGEGDFYDAVGVQEGDVVRRVNHVEMSNRGRAEFFIKQFADDRLNVFVIDIERDGKPQKIIYQIK